MNRQTTLAKNNEAPKHWLHVDADGQVLGRLATQIAVVLMGKHKPTYTPHHDVGDFVVVTNASKIAISGAKLDQKFRKTFSGHPSGQKTRSYRQVLETHPERLIEDAVRRMMPKSKLGRAQFKKLKVYADAEHPHASQTPKPLELKTA